MKKPLFLGVITTLILGITLPISFAQTTITYPEPKYVSDYANILTPEQENTLLERVLAFERETSNEIAVLIVRTTAPETIEQYSIHVTDKWKVGKEDKDNGILFTIAIDDRAMRLEIGQGLEGAIPDLSATKILDYYAKPQFREGNYYEGINNALDIVMASAKGEFDIESTGSQASETDNTLFTMIFYGGLLAVSWISRHLAKTKSWWLGGVIGAGGAFGITLLLSFGIFVALFLALIFGVFGLILDFIVSRNYGKGDDGKGGGGWWFGGGSGRGGGWGGGGGGFGGGGFSGGGGSSRW